MEVSVAVPGGLDGVSGGHRYNRRLVDALRAAGDTVHVVALPERSPGRTVFDPLSDTVCAELNQPVDVLVEDALAHPSLVGVNSRLDGPDAIVSLVHYLRSASPDAGPAGVDRWLEATYFQGVDAAVTTSADTRDRLASLATVPTTVAYPGGRAQAVPSTETIRDGAREGPLDIVFVGALTPRKQPLAAVEALVTLADSTTVPWSASLIGSTDVAPAHTEEVEQAIEARGIANAVSLPGVVTDERLTESLASADVLLAPSRYEPFGMAILEAMEHGTVPIATTEGGPPEFIDHGESGVLVDPDAGGQLADQLVELATDRSRLATLAVGAARAAAAHPSWEDSLDRARAALLAATDDTAPPAPVGGQE